MELERFTFVLLRRPDDAPDLPEAELHALQEQHLAHLREMRARGVLAAAGPFEGQPDESLRGFCLYVTDEDETRRLVELDPSVRARRMAADVFSWWTAKGAVSFTH